MDGKDNLENVVRKGFNEIKGLLTNVKGDVASIKKDIGEVKGMAEKNTVDGKKRDDRIAILEARIDKLETSDQDHRRRNGRR